MKSTSGFSLVEMMVAIGIALVIVLGASELLMRSAKNNQLAIQFAQNKGDAKNFQAQFDNMLQDAVVSSQFQHLPAAFGCTLGADNDQGCVEQLNVPSSTFTPVANLPNSGPLTDSIEFFRDQDASSFTQTPLVAPSPGVSPLVTANTPLSLSTTDLSNTSPYFTTWRMKFSPCTSCSNSQPLLFLKYNRVNSGLFTVSSASPSNSGTRIVSLTDATGSAVQLSNHLVLAYDTANPAIFVIQYASASTDTGSSTGTVTLEPVDLDTTYFPSFLPTTALDSGWGNLGGSGTYYQSPFYAFPTHVSSLMDQSPTYYSNYFIDSNGYANLAQLPAYFWTGPMSNPLSTTSNTPDFAVVPIQAVAYYLTYRTSFYDHPCDTVQYKINMGTSLVAGTDPYSAKLVMITYQYGTTPTAMTVLDRVCGDIYFARRLGTSSISVFVYQNY